MSDRRNSAIILSTSVWVLVLAGCAEPGSTTEPHASASTAAAVGKAAARPAGCPAPSPDGLVAEEAEALAGTCLLPDVYSRFGGPGFVGGGLIDPRVSDDIFIYWQGDLDAATKALIAEAAAEGVHVEVRAVRYSEAEMMEASAAVVRSLATENIEVVSVEPSFDDITITITDAEAQPSAQQVAGLAAGEIPVSVVVGDWVPSMPMLPGTAATQSPETR